MLRGALQIAVHWQRPGLQRPGLRGARRRRNVDVRRGLRCGGRGRPCNRGAARQGNGGVDGWRYIADCRGIAVRGEGGVQLRSGGRRRGWRGYPGRGRQRNRIGPRCKGFGNSRCGNRLPRGGRPGLQTSRQSVHRTPQQRLNAYRESRADRRWKGGSGILPYQPRGHRRQALRARPRRPFHRYAGGAHTDGGPALPGQGLRQRA